MTHKPSWTRARIPAINNQVIQILDILLKEVEYFSGGGTLLVARVVLAQA